MSNLWERFESITTPEEVATAKVQFSPLDAGDYKVVLEQIEPSESKTTGCPMVKGKFRVIETNRVLFYNQMLQNLNYPNITAQNIAEAVTFIGGLLGEDIEFTGLGALATTIEGVTTGQEYIVNVSYGKKDFEQKFPKLKIVSKSEDITPVEDGDMPF